MNIDLKLKTYEQLQDEIVTLHTNNYLNDLKINELQSNWNSLRELVDYQLKHNVGSSAESSIRNHVYQEIKDKMNELEGDVIE